MPVVRLAASTSLGTLLTDGELDSSPVTGIIDVDKFERLVVQTRLTRGGAATNVQCTVEESIDGVTFSAAMFADQSTGALTPMVFTRTTSVTENFSFFIDCTGYKNLRLTFDGAAATAADTVTVLAHKAVGS